MRYLSHALPALALAASIDARVLHQDLNRRHMDAARIAAADPTAACPCSCSDPAAMSLAGPAMPAPAMPAPAMPAPAMPAPAAVSSNNMVAAGNATAAAGAGAKAIYFMTNQDANSIIMLPVQADGKLADGSIIATGGKGASLIDGKTNQSAQSDTLASQGAVRVVGSSLFAVNPGSNSLSMFAIDPQNPAKLAAVGQPVQTGGDVRSSSPSPSPSPPATSLTSNVPIVPDLRRRLRQPQNRLRRPHRRRSRHLLRQI